MAYTSLPLLVCLVLMASHLVQAHYILNTPKSRGFDDDGESKPVCGSFNSVMSPRVSWDLTSPITITSYHPNADLNIFLSLSENPTTVDDFKKISYQRITQAANLSYTGIFTDQSVQPLGVKALTDLSGKDATLMMTYDGGDGLLYQCSDLTITPGAKTSSAASGKIMSVAGILAAGVFAALL
ncbi:hypothetical protein RI367_002288 [Sorochytrium milnesiophthora]